MLLTLSFLAPTLSLPANASAGCVTKKEFKQAKKGMSKSSIASKFGTNGKRFSFSKFSGYTLEIRSYKTCSPYDYGTVSVSFENGKMSSKTGIWI
jgi:hypothetical protein